VFTVNPSTVKALAIHEREIKGCLILIETIPESRYDRELAETLEVIHSRLQIAWAMLERSMTESNAPRRSFGLPSSFRE
jgi:hypothetical protein